MSNIVSFHARLPKDIHVMLREEADRQGVSMNTILNRALSIQLKSVIVPFYFESNSDMVQALVGLPQVDLVKERVDELSRG